jgi:HSP20 family molecular chaperone IbpA
MSETRSAPPRQSRPAPEAGRDWHDRLEDLRRETSHLLDVMYEKIGREHQAVSGRVGRNFPPPSDLGTTETGFELAVELPGVDEADIPATC